MVRQRKNLILCVFLSALICLLLFSFAACETSSNTPSGKTEQNQTGDSDNTPEYETVEISTNNYDDYLAVSVEIADSNIEYIGENALGLDRYVLSCVGNIKVSRTGNYQFENVTVLFGVTVQGWLDGMLSANVELDYDGNGQYSFNLSKESSSNKFDLTSRDCNISVYAAKGNIRIYE